MVEPDREPADPQGGGTGRTTATISLRLPKDIVDGIRANADAAGVSVSTYLLPVFANLFPGAAVPPAPEPATDAPLSLDTILRALQSQKGAGPNPG